jgi:hypothetical protein
MKNCLWPRGIPKEPQLPKRCFISHAYDDRVSCEKLVRALPRGVKPIVYPPITVRPEQLVSTPLIRALSACDGLIYLTGGQSDRSFWVAFERDYALRLGKEVFSANPDTLELLMSTERPLDLAVFASYHHIERDRVRKICDFMKKERNFDIWFDQERLPMGDNVQEAMHSAIKSYVSRGYVVVFWSRQSAQSEWVEYEYRTASEEISNFNDRVLFALLDESPIPDFWMEFNEPAVRIYGDEVRSETQRLDDLIVRLYWLIDKKSEPGGIHAEG